MTKAEQLHNALLKRSETRLTVPTPSIKKCQEILDELDKPELGGFERKVLQSLVDNMGCVLRVDDEWRYLVLIPEHGAGVDLGQSKSGTGTYDEALQDMIDDDLLHSHNATLSFVGFTHFARVGPAGREAIK